MTGDSLEALLDDKESSGQPTNVEGFKLSELIAELDRVMNTTAFYSKSDITSRNLRGILKAQAFQEYLFHRYGFRIKVLEKLIEDKLQNVLSVDRKGRKEIADMISKGTMKIEAKSGLDIADKLLGGGSPR